ncbi:MAG: long-chain fatty acid--CoA ligase [Spirochaetota bacterium]
MSQFKTINEMFLYAAEKYGNKPLYFTKDKSKKFQGESVKQLLQQAENAGIALLEMGLQPGEKVGLMSDNCYEWAIADLSVLLNGAVNVPRGSDSTPQEIQYILEHSGSKFCFIEHGKLLEKVLPIIEKTSVEKLIVLEAGYKSDNEKVVSLKDLLKTGKELREKHIAALHARRDEVTEEDTFTIIYTSGTTGMPKGVMLSHKNIVYNVTAVPPMIGIISDDRSLSILPIWHIFERAMYYSIISMGISYAFTNIRDLRDDFGRVKPTFMASAPRLWENIYMGIKGKVDKASPIQKMLFDSAYEICKNYRNAVDYLEGNKLRVKDEEPLEKAQNTAIALFNSVNLLVPARIMDALVFSKIRDVMGGEFRGTISGGGALPAHVDEFFNVIGIPVYEGYGMTECAPIISVRSVGKVIQGSVGFPPAGTDIRILDEKGNEMPQGELGAVHVRGPQVMQGYYNNPEATSKVLNNGWMNTGDLGFISKNGTLSLRGRAKDTIVLLGGENVEPVPIENLLLKDDHINQVIVVGQDQKTLSALIWPDLENLSNAGFTVASGQDLNTNKELRSHFMKVIKKQISTDNGFKSFEKVTDFRFLPKAMEVGDELTNLFKMKRNIIAKKYESLVKDIYS